LRVELDGERAVVLTGEARHEAHRVVLALGPWWKGYAPLSCPLELTVTRQVQLWVTPREPARFAPARFPVFVCYGSDVGALVYGLPEVVHPGLKLALHDHGPQTDPEAIDREIDPTDPLPVRRFLERFLPEANGPLLGARVCMYTNSRDGHFGLGPHPEDPRVLCALGFSGHGFKLAPSVGRILADYAETGASERMLPLFALDRDRAAMTP
jgi:glycine/D-amino acid oxidase-like deaminating enzyme